MTRYSITICQSGFLLAEDTAGSGYSAKLWAFSTMAELTVFLNALPEAQPASGSQA